MVTAGHNFGSTSFKDVYQNSEFNETNYVGYPSQAQFEEYPDDGSYDRAGDNYRDYATWKTYDGFNLSANLAADAPDELADIEISGIASRELIEDSDNFATQSLY
jgi:hypothetical protein